MMEQFSAVEEFGGAIFTLHGAGGCYGVAMGLLMGTDDMMGTD